MEQIKKKKSRDAARHRRGKQNDEFGELASQLPLPETMTEKLDRLCVMKLSNSYIKIKHVLQQIKASSKTLDKEKGGNSFQSCIQDALGGFMFVLAEDGQCLYVSPNVSENLGLQQLEVTGNSIYKYVHPCDQKMLAKQLGGQVPLEDMEIFDGLFCSDTQHFVKNPKQAINPELENSPHRSFFLRMRSTLTSRRKSVNINASIYRVVHCIGTIQMYQTKRGAPDSSMTRCLLAIGNPLLSNTTFEVPVDQQTFVTKHTLDMKLTDVEDLATDILGYKSEIMNGTSWYIYTHMCDSSVLKACHDMVLNKGQAVSGYYRVLVKNGGWIWMQTKANTVYLSTTGQPQYIICVHYVISGLELEDQVLSTEQAPLVTNKTFVGKRNLKTEDQVTACASPKYHKTPIVRKQESVDVIPPMGQREIVSLKDKMGPTEEDFLQDIDDSDMPGLEFLDVADGFVEIPDDFPIRSPSIPPPFADTELKDGNGNSEVDLSFLLEESEMIDRAPYIPPPCIDKIISFNDLPLPDLDNYQDETPAYISGYLPNDTSSMLEHATMMNMMYNVGNAKVPMHLLSKHLKNSGKTTGKKPFENAMYLPKEIS